MSNDLISPENLSKELLKSVLEDAYMEVSFDSEGDLFVKDNINCFILFNEDSKEIIRLLTFFGIKENVDRNRVLEGLNTINSQYAAVRAFINANGSLCLDDQIYIRGGITRKNFVLFVRFFCSIPRAAVREYALDIVG